MHWWRPDHVAIGGDSVGGGLTAVVALMTAGLVGQVAWWASNHRHGDAHERARIRFLAGHRKQADS